MTDGGPSEREQLLAHLAADLQNFCSERILRVAIDGVDGAGKTHFGDQLAEVLGGFARPVVRASVDGFHRSRAQRYARGRDSAEGFYLDSYDYPLLKALLLEPLSPHGSRRYRAAGFDHVTDQALETPWCEAPPAAILLFDGIFLQRPELRGYWDVTIFLAVDFAISIPRGAQRGMGDPNPDAASNQRYIGGQRLYLEQCEPAHRADVVIDNRDLERPRLLKGLTYPATSLNP